MTGTMAGTASHKHPKFAPLTLDFTFKKAFASERSKNLLLFLLNAFLAEKLKCPIREVKLVRNEMTGKTKRNRGSLFDVSCEDESGNRFIVEIQIGWQKNFISRTFFYLCMIISNLAKKGKDYDFNLPKLYSISFMDFDLDFGKGCTEVVQHLSMRNDKHPEICYDILQMTFVVLPRFKKNEGECRTIMDKILYSLKNGHKLRGIPRSFKEKELREIFEVAKVSNFTSVELAKWESAMMNRYDYKTSMRDIKERGMEEGEARGIGIGLKKAAKNMLAKGYSIAEVIGVTNLPREQVRALRRA
jgi:predicted transposase/invertase (TIGR01784 family)